MDAQSIDLATALRTTGSARAFRPDPVDDAALYRVLELARFAPSGGNRQGWRVLVVKDPETRQQVAELCQTGWRQYAAQLRAGVRPFAAGLDGRWIQPDLDSAPGDAPAAPFPLLDALPTVPVLLIVLVDLTEVAAVDMDLDRVHVVGGGSIYPFVQNILLAARSEGLAGVMTTFVVREEAAVRALLGIPAQFAVASLVALGVPEQQITRLKRRPVESFATIDRFDGAPLAASEASAP